MKSLLLLLPLALAATDVLADGGPHGRSPHWLGPVTRTVYDGVSDDLLTAGLGKTGLGLPFSQANFAKPLEPTAAELRRQAIHTNYRAVLDISPAGGYGRLYGPNVLPDGTVTSNEGKIAGSEYLAYARDRRGGKVTLMVQVPASFDVSRPCIVTGTSSGSRGIYGAIGSSGEWGLKRGCAVAYADKGSGMGVHDLQANTVNLLRGERADAVVAGDASHFTARVSEAERQLFNADTPNRLAFKHAHSQSNPEADWGRDTLRSVEFAFHVLRQQFPEAHIRRSNTVVIASSISNGGGAALAAAEQDEEGWIDGVAVAEPNIQIERPAPRDPVIRRAGLPDYSAGSRPLLDYFTFANLYQPCAALSARAADAPLGFPAAFVPLAQARCQSLADRGLLASTTTAAQAEEALDKLLAYGWEPQTIALQVSHWRFATPAIAMTYSNAHARASVLDKLCGLSFAFTDAAGNPVAANALALAQIFGTGNGVPPTAGINLVNEASVGGPKLDTISISPSTGRADLGFDGALCQRELVTGTSPVARRVQAGVREVQQRGFLRGKPAIIVHGRADTLVPVNFSSRPYVAAQLARPHGASLSYVEVENAQHFDSFLSFPGYDTRFVPLHVYFIRAMDAMWKHLTSGQALPPSQVVRTTPRGGLPGAAPALNADHVPPISSAPAATDRVVYFKGVLQLP